MAERAEDTYDLAIIGGGPDGSVPPIRAAQPGFRTACVEKYSTLGGPCLNVGCIPSKALLDSSEHFAYARHRLAGHGIKASVELDLAAMMKRKDQVVRDLTRGIEGLFAKNRVTWMKGTARLLSAGEIEVAGASGPERIRARRVLIATGSKAGSLAGIAFDGRRIVHSTDALSLGEVPRRLTVVGAGAIGLELGSVWLRLGSEVRVLESMDRAVPGMDQRSGLLLQRSLEKQGMRFVFGASVRSAATTADGGRVGVREG